jgi:hypothetical protein
MPYEYGAENIEFVVLADIYRQFFWSKPRARALSMGAQEQKMSNTQNVHTTNKNVPNMWQPRWNSRRQKGETNYVPLLITANNEELHFLDRAENFLTKFGCWLSRNMGSSNSWSSQGLCRPVIGLRNFLCASLWIKK